MRKNLQNQPDYIELSCSQCSSRRNLIMAGKPGDVLFDIKCVKHYTEYLQTKIIRLEELMKPDKKKPIK